MNVFLEIDFINGLVFLTNMRDSLTSFAEEGFSYFLFLGLREFFAFFGQL